MSKHIIIGAGLGGLYLANRLINEGVNPENIVIIEKRKKRHYTRPGHLNCSTFGTVSGNIRIPTPHTPAHHIKELERVMYDNLSKLNVEFIEETFTGLQPQTETTTKAVTTCAEDGTLHTYPADYVFDCSGKEAQVAKAVNAYHQSIHAEPAFITSSLVDINPIPDHCVAHVVIPDHRLIYDFLAKESEAVPDILEEASAANIINIRERLSALGWTYNAFPTFYSHNNERGHKVCLYMETPPDLPKIQRREWIELLLDIYSKGRIKTYDELKPSRKYGEKPRIVGFKNEPYVLNKVVHESDNLPLVMMAFDSVKGFDYRLAHGVTSGITCCEHMLRHIRIANGSIERIDASAIERDIFEYINTAHKDQLTTRLTSRQEAIEHAFDYFSEVYEKAARELPHNESDKAKAYQATAGQLAYQAAMIQFSKLELPLKTTFSHLELLNQCVKLLSRACTLLKGGEPREYQDASEKLQSVLDSLRTEINIFDAKQKLTNSNRWHNLFKSIQDNVQLLEMTPDIQSIQDKAKTILEIIPSPPPEDASTLKMETSFNNLFRALLSSNINGRAPLNGPLFFLNFSYTNTNKAAPSSSSSGLTL